MATDELQQEIDFQKAQRILRQYAGWWEDMNDPPSLRDGWTRPSNEDLDWARAVVALRERT
jgi:hypothetical protein